MAESTILMYTFDVCIIQIDCKVLSRTPDLAAVPSAVYGFTPEFYAVLPSLPTLYYDIRCGCSVDVETEASVARLIAQTSGDYLGREA